MSRTIHAHFTRTVQYPVTVTVPDGVKLVQYPDGIKVEVEEPLIPGGAVGTVLYSLQAAAEKGYVAAKAWEA